MIDVPSGFDNRTSPLFLDRYNKILEHSETYQSKYSFPCTIHAYYSCLNLAAESFYHGEIAQGIEIFKYFCENPRTFAHRVYHQLCKIKNSPEVDLEYGRKSFYDIDGLFPSSTAEKALAIYMSLNEAVRLGETDLEEIQMQENKIYGFLAELEERPREDDEYGRQAFYNLEGHSASLETKILAIRLYAKESRRFTCYSEGKEVRVIRKGDGLKYWAHDCASGRVWNGPIACEGRSVEDRVLQIAKRHLTFKGDHPDFSPLGLLKEWPGPVYNKETGSNIEVGLFLKCDQLIWHAIDYSKETSSWIWAGNDAYALMNAVSSLDPNIRAEVINKGCDIKMKFLHGKLVQASIKPRVNNQKISNYITHASSQLDSQVCIDKDNWAVTLISAGASSDFGISGDPFFGHAEIIYEGVENGVKFTRLIHWVNDNENPGYGKVVKKNIEESKISYRKKTQTWPRSKAQVEMMINSEDEKDKSGQFGICGNPEIYEDFLATIFPAYINLRVLFESASLELLRVLFKSGFSFAFVGNPGLVLGRLEDRQLDCLRWAIHKLCRVSMEDKELHCLFLTGVTFTLLLQESMEISQLFPLINELFQGHMKDGQLNCLTSAINKLLQGGIQLPPVWSLGSMIAVPDTYVEQLKSQPSLAILRENKEEEICFSFQ